MFTDHQPLVKSLHKQSDPWSTRQQRHLSYISEHSTDIRHIAGKHNIIADYLSRYPISDTCNQVSMGLDLQALAAAQSTCQDTCQLGPRYQGQLTRMAEPIPPSGQSSSCSLTTLSSSSSTDRRAETDRKVITTRIAVAHHFRCRLRRRESCILGATSSQPTLPLHELPPARLMIHRQTSAHERRKGTLSVQSRSGILADFCPRQH